MILNSTMTEGTDDEDWDASSSKSTWVSKGTFV